MYKHILLPTDGSELSRAAISYGIALAKATGAEVTALIVSVPVESLVVDPCVVTDGLREYKALVAARTGSHLADIQEEAGRAGVRCSGRSVEQHRPYEAIVETACHAGCDLIVMASNGLNGVSALLGSETLKVLTHTPVPVLVYR